MRRLAGVYLVAVALLLASWQCFAQLTTTGAGGVGGAGATYSGPGNIAAGGIAFHSCGRAYTAAYAAALNAACDVVDTATGLISGTLHFLATGFVNTTEQSGAGQPCLTACRIAKMYDQTGNGNHVVQATLANMPALTFNALNGLPCPAGTGSATTNLASVATIAQAAPYSVTAVAERTGSFTTVQRIIRNGVAGAGLLTFGGTANTIGANNGTTINLTANDGAPHALLSVASAIDPLFAIDSNTNISTSSNGTTALSSNVLVMGLGAAGGLQAGLACEDGIWGVDLNAAYQAELANMHSAAGWNF
jgi:hypothetical protein